MECQWNFWEYIYGGCECIHTHMKKFTLIFSCKCIRPTVVKVIKRMKNIKAPIPLKYKAFY